MLAHRLAPRDQNGPPGKRKELTDGVVSGLRDNNITFCIAIGHVGFEIQKIDVSHVVKKTREFMAPRLGHLRPKDYGAAQRDISGQCGKAGQISFYEVAAVASTSGGDENARRPF